MSNTTDTLTTEHRSWIALVVTGLIVGATFISIYVGIQRSPEPLHLPLAVVGEQLAKTAESGFGDAVAVTEVKNVADGITMVRDGTAVGEVDLAPPTALNLNYAGAKGVSESTAARALVAGLAAHAQLTVQETDIVPLAKYDSRGLSSFYVVFGVTLSSFVLAQGLMGAVSRVRLRHRLYTIGGFAVVIGAVAATIAGPVMGVLTTPWPILWVTLALLSASVAFTTKALGAWLGAAGIAIAVLMMTTIGNAVSGATIGFDLLPSWAQAISGVLPPGAAVRAVNDFGYFTPISAWPSLIVLSIWAIAGFALVLLRRVIRFGRREAGAEGRALVARKAVAAQ